MNDHGLRILVVDEDPAQRDLIHALVEGSGWECMEVCNSPDGLAKTREFRPDIVVTEWSRPAIDGLGLVRAIRAEDDTYRPYIVVAIRQEDEDRLVEALQAGADDFVAKPLKPALVAARLQAGQRIVRVKRQNEHYSHELRRYSEELAESRRRLCIVSMTDELTGLPNRGYALDHLRQEWLAADACASPLSCMVIDVDHLQQINDRHGTDRGDVVLKTVAAVIKKSVRVQDIVCRIGGDEFLVICPATTLDGVTRHGERLAATLESFGNRVDKGLVALSIGVASRTPDIGSHGELISRAEQGMYRAKRLGGNRVYRTRVFPAVI